MPRPGHRHEQDEDNKPDRRHGKEDSEPSGRHGKRGDDGDEAGRPGRTRPGRGDDEDNKHGKRNHGRADDDEPEAAVRPGHARLGHGKADEEDKPGKAGHERLHKPGHEGHGGGGGGGHAVQVKEGESIQAALEDAQPGTTIMIGSGVYNESLKSRCDGTKDKPITIQGPRGGSPAIIKGSDKSGTCVEINHDYYILDGFTIDGQICECSSKDDVKDSFREKCLAIRGNRNHREMTASNGDRYPSAVEGCVVRNMKIINCGGEGVRLRYFVTHTKIYHNKITSTGCYDFKFGGDQGKKNGEGIYIGTSSKQWEKNLTGEQDICRWNHVYENYINTNGNECVDVKEGSLDTIIEKNFCTGQLDADSGGIDSRADKSIIRYNKVASCTGAGVRLGGHKVGDVQYGIHCQVYCNQLVNNKEGGIKIMTEPHQICQNDISGEGSKYKVFRGVEARKFEEKCECPFDVQPLKGDLEKADWFQQVKNM